MKKFCQLILMLCVAFPSFAQQRIKGQVLDASTGDPLIGVSVTLKSDPKTGSTTDYDGQFTLLVPSLNEKIKFTYIGYVSQELNAQSSMTVRLVEDTQVLDEVVVIGYGTQRKADVTSSVASVKSDDFVKGSVKDVGQLIQGKVAGLAITNPSGDPTGGTQIRLRGTSTIGGANTAPLILIDGVPGDFNTVAPEDVESIDVLKDGSAAAIYGTRGTNGVILITTKQARGTEIMKVDYNGYISTSQIYKKHEMLNAQQFAELYPDYDYGYDTDWVDEITRTPVSHVHNLSLAGGTSRSNYIANVSYTSRQGIIKHSESETLRGRVEVTQRLFDDKVRLRFGILGATSWIRSANTGGAYTQATRRNPTEPVRNEDGSWYENIGKFEYENPMALLYEVDGNTKNSWMRFNAGVTYNPIKSVTLQANYSYRRSNRNYGYQETLNHISGLRDGRNGYSNVSASINTNKLLELTAQYDGDFGANKFTILGGYSYDESDYEDMWGSNYGFQDDYFGGWHNIGIGQALKDGKADLGSSKSNTNLIGFFGRITYAYDNKYLLMGALRYEGASQLWGTDNAWGLFPSVSAGWRITQENFMRNQDIFNDLKLRVGYGVTGSQPRASFLGVAMLQYGSYAYYNGSWIRTIVPASNPNPDLKWEEKKEFNVGLDYSLLNNRVNGSIDFYNRRIDGLIYDYSVPTPPNLYSITTANGGTMENRGLEVLVNVIPVKTKDFEWTTTATFSTNSNKLKSLNGSVFKTDYDYFLTGSVEYSGQWTESHIVKVGESIGNFYGFKVVDVDEDGRWIYENRDGELVNYKDFTHAVDDKKVIGNGLPKWYAGWNNSIRFRRWDLNVTMRGAFDFQIINGARVNYENTKNSRIENRLKSTLDPVFGKVPLSKEVEPEFNSYYVEDGDYWKIDNITIGYTFGKIGRYIKSLRVYGSVLNAFTFTKYKGIDPEVSTDGLTPGYDTRDRYPQVRSFTFGVNASF